MYKEVFLVLTDLTACLVFWCCWNCRVLIQLSITPADCSYSNVSCHVVVLYSGLRQLMF